MEQINFLNNEKEKINITSEIINNLIGINESFELPDKLMSILLNKEKRTNLFDDFLKYNIDLKNDCFRDYFQEEHSDRKRIKTRLYTKLYM